MKLSLAAVLACLSLVACAAEDPAADPAPESAESDVTAGSSPLEAGKYVSRGRILMIYSACSSENFLGDDAAKGTIEKGVMRAPEGNVCGAYTLKATNRGVIQVKWRYDQSASAHRDPEIAKFCRASEGTYEMTQGSGYVDPQPGTYVRGKAKLVIKSGCAVASHLGDDSDEYAAQSVIQPEIVDGKATAILRGVEGNICGRYALEHVDGDIQVRWVPAPDASAHKDPEIAKSCKAANGVYRR